MIKDIHDLIDFDYEDPLEYQAEQEYLTNEATSAYEDDHEYIKYYIREVLPLEEAADKYYEDIMFMDLDTDEDEKLPPYDADDNYIDAILEDEGDRSVLYQGNGVKLMRVMYNNFNYCIETDKFEIWWYPYHYNGPEEPHGLSIYPFIYNGIRKEYGKRLELKTRLTIGNFIKLKFIKCGDDVEVISASRAIVNRKAASLMNLKAFL